MLIRHDKLVTVSFEVCKSVHHRTIQTNHQPDATVFRFIILTFIYGSTCFGRCPAHHQELNDCCGSLWFYLRIVATVVLCWWSGRHSCAGLQSLLYLQFTQNSDMSATKTPDISLHRQTIFSPFHFVKSLTQYIRVTCRFTYERDA